MESSVILAHLQNQFSGQLVLYVDDIAKVLGKSDKAVSNLIARKALPFKVKTVGGLRCVDVFQVAEWLSSDQAIAEETVAENANPPPSKGRSRPPRSLKLHKGKERLPSGDTPALTGRAAAMLLKMRHGQASAMGRFVHGLRKNDDFVFMNEVMEKLFYTADQLCSSYVVIVKKLASKGAKTLAEETRKYFDAKGHADRFLTAKLDDSLRRRGVQKSKLVEHFVLEQAGETLFHATASDQLLTVTVNTIGMEFFGR